MREYEVTKNGTQYITEGNVIYPYKFFRGMK